MTPLLEQQELLEVPPERTVALPTTISPTAGWWGVDISTARYNIGFIDRDGQRGVHSVKLGAANDNEGERLNRFQRQMCTLTETMLAEPGVPLPGVVFVEQPGGQTVMPILWYAAGIAAQAIYQTVNRIHGYVPRVETMPPSKWKKIAVGRGNIYKPARKKGQPPPPIDAYPVWVWARTLGMPETGSWDDADAYGVAEAARKTIGIAR
jgi:hypothetical protein